VDSDDDDDSIVQPISESESVRDYDMARSEDEAENYIDSFDDTEEWEIIEKEVYDHTSNSLKQIPSTIFADDSIQQTLLNYIEKYRPTEQQIEQFQNAIGVLKFVAEFGYNTIKEPMIDWAESVVRGNLNCGLDEVPKLFLTRLLNKVPERTRNLLIKVPGSVCILCCELEWFSLTSDRTFRRHGFIESPDDQIPQAQPRDAD
jgi:hypothetical protein